LISIPRLKIVLKSKKLPLTCYIYRDKIITCNSFLKTIYDLGRKERTSMKLFKGLGIGALIASGLTLAISYLVHFVKGGYPWDMTDYTAGPLIAFTLLAILGLIFFSIYFNGEKSLAGLFWIITANTALQLLFHAICGNGASGFVLFAIIIVVSSLVVKRKTKNAETGAFVRTMIFVLVIAILISFLMAFATVGGGSDCPACGGSGMMKMPNGGYEVCPRC
jgi:hypothetical protein